MKPWTSAVVLAWAATGAASAADLNYKDKLLAQLVEQVPGILESFDAESGRFGSGIWVCGDQNVMYPLAVAYSTPGDGNPYYKDAKLLEVIAKSAQPLVEKMDDQGRWIFEKKDGSTWGMIWMPWTYSRWVRTFGLVSADLSAEARKTWTDALTLGYTGISKHSLNGVHNIPSHYAMGLYAAGKALQRPEWCEQAAEFMVKVVGAQSEGGYWPEGGGPVVEYNFVYVDAVGSYYAMSADQRMLPSLEKAAAFHRHFTYPGGQNVETIDQRNPYHDRIASGNVGFTFTPVGRAYLATQWLRRGLDNLDADLIASLLLYGVEGPIEEQPSDAAGHHFVLTEGGVDRAATLRHGPWFVCLSAYTTLVDTSRWIQDRQNFVSIFHDETGLIVGGGNTKLQPAWSSFTVGDVALLAHTPGDANPNFQPRGKLYHVPSAAKLVREPDWGLDLTYGPETCRVRIRPKNDRTLDYEIQATANSNLPVVAHVTLLPQRGQELTTGTARKVVIGDEPLILSPEQLGGSIACGSYRLQLPKTASLHWPAIPHNPYRKDGRASADEGRIEIRLPFTSGQGTQTISVEIVR